MCTKNIAENLRYNRRKLPIYRRSPRTANVAGNIAGNFKTIEDNDSVDLGETERLTGNIASNLKRIEDNDPGDLEELEARLDRILEKLDRVKRRQ